MAVIRLSPQKSIPYPKSCLHKYH
ncbi:MAG: hypothetical protein RI909_58, partial [Bacteroidota bacterium]